MQNTLALIREKTGHGGVVKFVEQELGLKYRSFVNQIEKGNVPYRTIKVIIEKLDIKFEDFKDFEFDHKGTQTEIKIKKEKRKEEKIEASIEDIYVPQPKKLSEIFAGK